MNLPDIKALKKLATACRASGIKHFKSADFEFTLTEDLPQKKGKAKPKRPEEFYDSATDSIDRQDSLTQDQLLFYSVNDIQDDGIPKIGQ